ncbi:MAG: redoxin domain-containing protein [Blastocatellia bacterium]|nr:redoxin domain-containing protein [Blastocatellia bacterium]
MKRIVFGLCVVICLSLGAMAQPAAPRSIGGPAADFTLNDLAGRPHALKDHRGRTVVAVFLSTECPFSNAYHERLRAIAADYAGRGVDVLGINAHPDESLEQIREHAKRNRLTFPILKDEGSRVADSYGATRTPEVFVIDAAGALRYHGRIDNSKDLARIQRNDLREALDELLAGKAVSVAETKSFGCPVKMVRKPAAATAEERTASLDRLPGFVNAFAPQTRKAPAKRPVAKAAPAGAPRVALLKPADFEKLKNEAKGKVLVINFWATWCSPCVAEFPEFIAIDEKYRARGVEMVGISADDSTELKTSVTAFLRKQKAAFRNFVQDTDDPQQMVDVVDKEWPGVLPATFIYDKQGVRVYKRYGIIDREELLAAIEKALK